MTWLAMNDRVLAGALYAVTIVAGLSVVASAAATLAGYRRAYMAMRISMAAAWLWLAFCATVILHVLFSISHMFGSKPAEGEIRALWEGTAVMAVPGIVGMLAAIGPRRRGIHPAGRFLIHVISPAILVWLLFAKKLTAGSGEFWWCVVYLFATAACWELLAKAGRDLRPS